MSEMSAKGNVWSGRRRRRNWLNFCGILLSLTDIFIFRPVTKLQLKQCTYFFFLL